MPPTPPPFDDRHLSRTIIRLALPAMAESVLVTLVLLVDTVFIGWLRDPDALASVSLAGTFFFVLQGLFFALGVGATALVARAWGAGNRDEAVRVGEQAIGLAAVVAVIVGAAAFFLAPAFMRLMGAEAVVARGGALFIRIVMLSAPVSFAMIVANAVMRGAGDTVTPLVISVVYNAVNLCGDIVLIFGAGPIPALGMPGAACATAAAGYVAAVVIVLAFRRRWTRIAVGFAGMARWEAGLMRRLWRVAAPSLVEMLLHRASHLVFMGIVTSLGTVALAAHAVGVRIESISFMPGWAVSIAAATLVGQALGARDPELAQRAAVRAIRIGVGLMSTIALSFALFGPQIAACFRATPDVVGLAGFTVRIGALSHPFMAWYFVLAGAHRGAGDTRRPLIVTTVGAVFFRLVLVYVFGVVLGGGLPGVWWGCNADWCGRALLMHFFFRRGRWKTLQV